jgi:putative molybdopterin biosynthesis protein
MNKGIGMKRKIFKTLMSIEEAIEKFYEYFKPSTIGTEEIPLEKAFGRIVSEDIIAKVDIPPFDRAAMDGYAVRAEDTYGASEDNPIRLKLLGKIEAGEKPSIEVHEGEAIEIATGAPIPKGANAVEMIEYTHQENGYVYLYKPTTPGENIIAAGSDIMSGELVLREGQRITSREMGVLAAIGLNKVKVYKKPKVAIISTGNELLPPGKPLEYGKIYDINSSSLIGAVIESGGDPIFLGIARDDLNEIKEIIKKALNQADIVITSGSTSVGAGDKLYAIIDELGYPGIIVHGLTVKPGKPTIIAIVNGKPIFGLPGYPSSALMIFSILVSHVIRRMAGIKDYNERISINAKIPFKVFSAKGRREFLPVHLIKDESLNYLAYPIQKDSGAISSLSIADGFIEIKENQEFLEEGEIVKVNLFGSRLNLADLVIIGSHCIGIDVLIRIIKKIDPSIYIKTINVGSIGGLYAIKRGEADIAGIHLFDETTSEYNKPFIEKYDLLGKVLLIKGYTREQGFIVAKGNPKKIHWFDDLLKDNVSFINRNRGSGTRVLIDFYLKNLSKEKGLSFEKLIKSIKGYDFEVKSHSAIASAVLNEKADVGVGIKTVALMNGLDFIPIINEHYDFVIPKSRLNKKSIQVFLSALKSNEFKEELKKVPGLIATSEIGEIIID